MLSVFLSCFKVEALYWGRNKKTKEEHDGQLSDDIYALRKNTCWTTANINEFIKRQGNACAGRLRDNHYMHIYFDTPDAQLIRASLDKPVYKEKLRLRSYGR